MMKYIKTIGAFSLTFIISALLVGALPSNQRNISALLQQDISNGFERDLKIYNLSDLDSTTEEIHSSSDYSEAISEYVEASSSIDDTDLPADFQAAWHDHLAAWRTQDDYLVKNVHRCKLQKFDIDEFAQSFADQDAQISITWRKVLRVAEKYGVTVPRQYR